MDILSLKRKFRYGFTLIELLLVIGIIAILASIVIVAINPTKQLGDARDAQRRSDVNTILNAVYQYAIDNNGTLPPSLSTTTKEVCDVALDNGTCNTTNGDAYLGMLSGSYLVSIPEDPQNQTSTGTNYFISIDGSNRITVSAPACEADGCSISVTR